MGFWDGIISGLNSISPTHIIDTAFGQAAETDGNPVQKTMAGVSAGVDSSVLGAVDRAVRSTPAGEFIMDFGNRSVDTLVGSLAYAGHQSLSGGYESSWGAITDKDVWEKSWDSWGTAGHVSAGTILANNIFSTDDRVAYANPFDANDAQTIQANAQKNWYGSAVSGATDLAAGFIAPPGLGLIKRARTLGEIGSAAQADRVFEAMQTAKESDGGLASAGASRADKLASFVTNKPNANSQLSRLVESVSKTNDITSQSEMMAHLSPLMENAGENFKTFAADVFTRANALSPELATETKINTLLAATGSRAAREALITNNPLIARSLQNFMDGPRFAKMEAALADARLSGGEYNLGSIIDQVYGLAGDKDEIDALRKSLTDSHSTWLDLRQQQAKVAAAQPRVRFKGDDGSMVDTFDVARLKESRVMAATNVQNTMKELAAAKKDLAGSSRWEGAAAKTGDVPTAQDFSRPVGAAQQRVADLEARLAQQRQDLALFQQTPLQNVTDVEQWQAALDKAKSATGDAAMSKRWTEAELRTRQDALRTKKAEIAAGNNGFQQANDWLSQLHSIGDTDGYALGNFRTKPSRLDNLKTQARLAEMGEVVMDQGGWLPKVRGVLIAAPDHAWKAINSPRARGGINLAEPDKGVRELNVSLQRSGVFSPDEVKAYRDSFVTAKPGDARVKVVKDAEKEMLGRIADKHLSEAFPNLTTEQRLAEAQAATRTSIQAYGHGRAYVLGELQRAEESGDQFAMLRDDEGNLVAYDAPTLRSHMADTASFIDPGVFVDALRRNESTFRKGLSTTRQFLDGANTIWKHGALLRPGLGVRAMLDEGVRGTALIGAAAQMAGAVNGSLKIAGRLDPIAKLTGGALEKYAFLADHPEFDIGNGNTWRADLSEDRARAASIRSGLTKGGSISGNLLGSVRGIEDKVSQDWSTWRKYKADSPDWHQAYAAQAKVMAASPTVRRMLADMKAEGLAGEGMDAYVRDLFKDPEIRAEYDLVARRGGTKAAKSGMTRDEFARQVMGDTMKMFPTPEVADAVLSGKLSKGGKRTRAWIEDTFPRNSGRFDVPGPQSVLREDSIPAKIGNTLGKFYETVLDKPNYWLVRHPVYQTLYKRGLRHEMGDALLRAKEKGLDEIPFEDITAADRRARLNASTTVRNTFFDNTRSTNLGEHLRLISPFFNAWEDAAMSWSRLVYDDPRRVFRLFGGWNMFDNLSQDGWGFGGQPLIVDQYGNPVKRGEGPEGGSFIAVPVKLPKFSLPFIGDIGGPTQLSIRKDALNSIAQGDVPWLPGFGPVATVSTTALLTRMLPKDVLYAFAGTDLPVLSQIRDSMYLGGDVPTGDATAMFTASLPATYRNLFNDIWGTNAGSNIAYNLNQQYIDSLRTGVPLDPTKAYAEAERQAKTAGIVRSIASGLFGMSGKASVQGQFYVDQMHMMNQMTPDQLKAAGATSAQDLFSKTHPEAAGLKWSISKNETGINATVDAELAAEKYKSLIDKYPERGWFILGADNIIDASDPNKAFEGTAYNQQTTERYGTAALGRTKLDPSEAYQEAMISQGYAQFSGYLDQVRSAAAAQGIDLTPQVLARVKSGIVDYLGQTNREFYMDYKGGSNSGGLDSFFHDADQLAADPSMKDRQDMQEYVAYRQARQQILDAFGIKSFSGTSDTAQKARDALGALGEAASQQSLVFQQMWTRQLSREAR